MPAERATTPAHGTSPARIRVLSPLVANQIAAGEVVERPASVVKEVVENALDAGASRITVELEQGGIELVRVTDDGHGMEPDDLPLAVSAHATSKIAAVGDLDHIATLGFRGEALASIASVSRLTLRSRTRGAMGASQLEAEGDRVSRPAPAPGPVGTQVTIRNLFFNTPARRKFLRTIATEQGRCVDAVRDLALAHPSVGFTLSADGRTLIDVPPHQTPRERVLALLGRELAPELLEVHADAFDDARGIALWGLVGKPALARPTNRAQHLLVNGRSIRDRTIQHALAEAFRGLIEPSRYPLAVLMLDMAPAGVDVNVHPAKAEVRFRDSSLVHSVVLRAVRDALAAADLTPVFTALSRPALDLPGAGLGPIAHPAPPAATSAPVSARAFVEFFQRARPASGATPQGSFEAIRDALAEAPPAPPQPPEPAPDAIPAPIPSSRVLQVHKSYLVTQDDQGMVIIDQHALHERAMFEYLIARLSDPASPGLESQRLLTPAVVQASSAHVDRLADLTPLLTRLGIVADALSSTSIAVHAFPTFLFDRGVDPVELMAELLEKTDAAGFVPTGEETLRDILDMMACKAAVKAGDRLSDLELADLVKLRGDVERSSNCPHGRPTSIRLTIAQLEKLFGRA